MFPTCRRDDRPVVDTTPRGDLEVTRIPDGSGNAEPTIITVTLDRLLTGDYGGIWFERGVAQVPLAPGDTFYVSGLPAGTEYEVGAPGGTVIFSAGTEGMILPDQTAQAGLSVALGDLEIVEGEGDEEGDVQEGTEETAPEEGEVPEEDWEELPEEGEAPAEEEPVDVPKTGDVAPSIGLALLFGLAACAAVLKKARAK